MVGNFMADAILWAVPLLFGVIAHEVAHGWTAEKLGDPTARLMGRITLNPLVHIDMLGTIVLPAILLLTKAPFLFGWAKPVPVQSANLRRGRRDMALVALSGPLTNFFIAVVSALACQLILVGAQSGWIPRNGGELAWIAEPVFRMAIISVKFNLVLTLVNLLPIPPLDGGRVLAGVLPDTWALRLERLEGVGMLIVLVLIGTGVWGYIVNPIFDTLLRLFLN